MGKIFLEGMEFHAYHGVYEEENVVGNHFEVDIVITTSFGSAANSDDVADTINYETVYKICELEMRHTVKLIETLGQNIMYSVKRQFPSIQEMTIKIKKRRPIPGKKIRNTAIEISNNFQSACGRCGSELLCYGDGTCWCFDKTLTSGTRKHLNTKYSGCICSDCMSYYGARDRVG